MACVQKTRQTAQLYDRRGRILVLVGVKVKLRDLVSRGGRVGTSLWMFEKSC